MKHLLILFLLAEPIAAQELSVVHQKRFERDGKGKIEITEQGIEYRAEKEKHSRSWKWEDIQYFDRMSETEFTILTYEDQRLLLGRDRQYHFRVTEGVLSDELFERVSQRIHRPLTNRVTSEAGKVQYRIPVKHLHTFGGCEGTLEFTQRAVRYVTDHKEDRRSWQLGRDVQLVSSSDPYRIQFQVYENNRREFSQTRIYRFVLKEPLDADFYRSLQLRLYDLETTLSVANNP